MQKKRIVEVVITTIFILGIFGYMFIGMRYYAGSRYAPITIKYIFMLASAIIYLGLVYYAYRFIMWIIKIIKK